MRSAIDDRFLYCGRTFPLGHVDYTALAKAGQSLWFQRVAAMLNDSNRGLVEIEMQA